MPQGHGRPSFFKYMPADTAKTVLANRTLRWSSPLRFNDPFDVPRELSFGITPAHIVEALSARLTYLLQHPPTDTSALAPKVRLLVETVKKDIPAELLAELFAELQEVAAQHQPTGESMEELRAMWRQCLKELRILCLTENAAHAAMWYHYADRYAGAVLEFRCNESTDSPWLIARPVDYPQKKPAVYTADGWAEILTLRNDEAVRRMLDVATYTKATDWSYENEWRIVSFKRPHDVGEYTDYSFNPNDLASVYVGPLMSPADRSAIAECVRTFPSAKLISVSLSLSREFVFDEAAG